jgi:hypothetical protein
LLLQKHVSIHGNALTFASLSVAAETHATEPLSDNGLLRLSGVMLQYVIIACIVLVLQIGFDISDTHLSDAVKPFVLHRSDLTSFLCLKNAL